MARPAWLVVQAVLAALATKPTRAAFPACLARLPPASCRCYMDLCLQQVRQELLLTATTTLQPGNSTTLTTTPVTSTTNTTTSTEAGTTTTLESLHNLVAGLSAL